MHNCPLDSVSVLITCHNRRQKTLACLNALPWNAFPNLHVYLVDDGSDDGTAASVVLYQRVTVIQGDGDLYWAGGMALAMNAAVAANPDFCLWLNDDVTLMSGAIELLVTVAKSQGGGCVVVGSTMDFESKTTYGGYRRKGPRPRHLVRVEPASRAISVNSFNGNIVLVDRATYQRIGLIDGAYGHGYADHDYAYRCVEADVPILLAPGHLGVCERAQANPLWLGEVTLRNAFRALLGPKGMPIAGTMRFYRRHAGLLWFAWAAASYLKAAIGIAARRIETLR